MVKKNGNGSKDCSVAAGVTVSVAAARNHVNKEDKKALDVSIRLSIK